MKTFLCKEEEPTLGIVYIGAGEYSVIYAKQLVERDRKNGTAEVWECEKVIIKDTPSFSNAFKTAIRERVSESEEYALINAYNSSKAGIEPSEEKEREYLDFLQWRAELKAKLKAVFTKD